MEQLQFTNANKVTGANIDFKASNSLKNNSNDIQPRESVGVSQEAANSLRAQVLYKKQGSTQEYLQDGLDKKQIIQELKNTNKMGRSFFGYKRAIANIITQADDTKLATSNFNYLLNAKGGKLNKEDVYDILLVATSINNGKVSEKLQDEYGFNGGALKEENVDTILEEIKKQNEAQQFAMIQVQMQQKQMIDEQFMQQMMLEQQMMMQQQMMIDQQNQMMLDLQIQQQQMMMSTPGFGFC